MSSEIGKIGSIALKDHENRKIPPKKLRYVKYHRKIELLPKNSITGIEVTASARWISVHLIKAKKNPLQPPLIEGLSSLEVPQTLTSTHQAPVIRSIAGS